MPLLSPLSRNPKPEQCIVNTPDNSFPHELSAQTPENQMAGHGTELESPHKGQHSERAQTSPKDSSQMGRTRDMHV